MGDNRRVQTPDATATGTPGIPREALRNDGRGAAQPEKRAAVGPEVAGSCEGFRAALRRSRPSSGAASADPNGPDAATLAGFRLELDRVCGRLSGPPREPEAARAAIDRSGTVSRASQVARVLLGTTGGDVAEARIRIGGEGPGAAEIRLAATRDGRSIEAHLLTAADGSRETLAVMLDEIRMRLRARGVVLRAWPDGRSRRDPGSQPRPRDDR